MSRTKTPNKIKATAPQKTDKTVYFANIYHFFFLPILVLVALFWRGKTLLVMGSGFVVFALYSLIGYKCRWKHIYLAFQEMQKQKMTPKRIDWNTIELSKALKFPIMFGILGAIMIVYQLFYV